MNSIRSHKATRISTGLPSLLPAFPVALLFLVFTTSPIFGQNDTLIRGVQVSFKAADKMFPGSWYKKKVNAQAESLLPGDAAEARRILVKALDKYPVAFPPEYLDGIYVLKSMKFYGYPFGGTYTKRKVYLAYDETNITNTDQYVEQRFHQEFSSILWRENHRKLNLAAWLECNAPGFKYGEGGAVAIAFGIASMETDSGYFNIGFLNRYAMTEVEQDINVIAQNLFAGGPEFWKIVDANERIRAKTLLLIGFYHALDPMFTEEYFRKLSE